MGGLGVLERKKIEAAINRTVAIVKNGTALQVAVNNHCDRADAALARVKAAFDRKRQEIEDAETDPQRRVRRIERLARKCYQAMRDITRKADRILIGMLKRATEAGEWR